jgi:Alpha amylase, C-terminal all-beta domain
VQQAAALEMQLDGNGFGVDTARKLVVYHRWDDGGTKLCNVALNFSDQSVGLQFATNGTYQDVLNGSNIVNVVGNRAVVTIEANWEHVYFQGV